MTLRPSAVLLVAAFAASALHAQSPAFLEPPDGRTYHGVQTAFGGHVGYLAMLADSTIQPAVRGIFISIPGTRAPSNAFAGLRAFLAGADSVGYIPEIGLFLVTSSESPTGATDSAIATSTLYDAFLDTVVSICAGYGRRMFVRIGGEFNGDWNGGGYHPHLYATAFRKIVDLYAARGMRDSAAFVWCYEPSAPNDFDSVDVEGPLWYPGDEYADWYGLDVFNASDFDQSLDDYRRGVITTKGKSERFLAMARARGKPVYLNETSAKGVTITPDSLDSANDWDAWFARYWEFIAAHVEIKGFNYIDQDWESTGYSGWGDARIENSPFLSAWYRAEMYHPKYIHLPTRGTVAHVSAAAATTGPSLCVRPQPVSLRSGGIPAVEIELPCGGRTALTVYDISGRLRATLIDGSVSAGALTLPFATDGLVPGVYLLRLRAGSATVVEPLIVVR